MHLFLKFHKSCYYAGAWVAHEHLVGERSLSPGSSHCFTLHVCCKIRRVAGLARCLHCVLSEMQKVHEAVVA